MYERAKAQPENIVAPYDLNPPFTGPVNYVCPILMDTNFKSHGTRASNVWSSSMAGI